MPELPEVEVVKRSLERNILNLIIKKVKINDANLRYKVDKIGLSKLEGKKITKINRRSKFLIFEIGKTYRMLVHLGMTGKFFFADNKENKFKTIDIKGLEFNPLNRKWKQSANLSVNYIICNTKV